MGGPKLLATPYTGTTTTTTLPIGHQLPGDLNGWWGNVTGFDFCERNYAATEYAGELWCCLTNFIALPIYFAFVFYVWSKGGRVTPLTYIFLVIAFADEFCAGMSHLTMKISWSQAQERFLGCTYICFLIMFLIRYKGQPVLKAILCLLAAFQVFGGIVEAMDDFALTKWMGDNDPLEALVGTLALFVNPIGLVLLVAIGSYYKDFVSVAMGLNLAILTVAFYIFGITDVYEHNCMDLPIWLHEAGHMMGCLSDYISTVVLIALDPEVQKVLTPGRVLVILPGLLTKSDPRLLAHDEENTISLQAGH